MYCPDIKLSEKIIKKFGTPVFVTDKSRLERQVRLLKEAMPKNGKIFYAMKANYNPAILKVLKDAGIDGIDSVSPFEIEMAMKSGFSSNQIIFTGNNSDNHELEEIHKHNIIPNIGSISELKRFGELFPGSEVSIRFNPGIGAGEFKVVVTGGSRSKFGILESELRDIKNFISQYKLKVIGVHCHIGSGFYKTKIFKKAVRSILKIARNFSGLKFVDIGGGFGVRYEEKSKDINIKDFFSSISEDLEKFKVDNGCDFDLVIEPGKFLVAESTCLLTKVTNIKNNSGNVFVGTDTGMNHILRPALYSSYHHIINLSNKGAKKKRVNIVGNICESTDVLSVAKIECPREGDILAILTAGAYCASMSSVYNLRPYAAEVLIDSGSPHLIRESLNFKQIYDGLGFVNLV